MVRGGVRASLVVVAFLLVQVGHAALYGYWADPVWMTKQIVLIDTKTGTFEAVCDMSFLPVLAGGSSSANLKNGRIHLYGIDDDTGDVTLVSINPSTCDFDVNPVSGLNTGQDEVRDIKYDNLHQKLYMVLPDPNCMHGSLDEIDELSASVVTTVTQLVDPEGLSQTAALSSRDGKYYYIGLPFPPVDVNYRLNTINLASGDSDSQMLVHNDLGLGDMWGTNYTLSVWDAPTSTGAGSYVFGAVSPSNSSAKNCYPSGFYTVDTKTGTVSCVSGPYPVRVVPIAEFDTNTNLYYQIFADKSNTYYLYTYDVVKQSVVAKVQCDVCGKVEVLAIVS